MKNGVVVRVKNEICDEDVRKIVESGHIPNLIEASVHRILQDVCKPVFYRCFGKNGGYELEHPDALVSEVWLRFSQNLKTVRIMTVSGIRAFIYVIAIRVCVDDFRKGLRNSKIVLIEDFVSENEDGSVSQPEEIVKAICLDAKCQDDIETTELLEIYLTLRNKNREEFICLELSVCGFTDVEIATILGIHRHTVKSRKIKAKNILQKAGLL